MAKKSTKSAPMKAAKGGVTSAMRKEYGMNMARVVNQRNSVKSKGP